MSKLTQTEKEGLLKLARSTIAGRLDKGATIEESDAASPSLQEKCGCFVTLHKKGALRGCIGTIEPIRALKDCVSENAVNAAFNDPRFPSLKASELKEIDIEISVLTPPRPLHHAGPEDLLNKLEAGVHGVILAQGFSSATFLPQVWDQIPDKVVFLEHLCRKAGLPANAWKDLKTRIEIYEVRYFGE